MPLIDIFKRASKLVLNLQHADAVTSYEEGEVVFCEYSNQATLLLMIPLPPLP